jgi:hypothetical protein
MSHIAKTQSLGKRILKFVLIVAAVGTGASTATGDLRLDESLRSNTDDLTTELVQVPRRNSASFPLPQNEGNGFASSRIEHESRPNPTQDGDTPVEPFRAAWETASSYGVGSFASTALGSSASVQHHT